MRLLLVEHDPRQRARLRQHLSCSWPDIDLVVHDPPQRGPLPPEFLAQGYDAVLLAHGWPGGDGLTWLRELHGREGFAPIIFLSERPDDAAAAEVLARGIEVVAQSRIEHARLVGAVEAAARHQRAALAHWRGSEAGRMARRFGEAEIGGYRRVRQLATGSASSLYLAESERAGALVALKVTSVAQRDADGEQSFERFLQEHEIIQRIRHPGIVRLYELGISDEHAYLAMEYFPLGDLRRRMRRGFEVREALTLVLGIARALDAVHCAGVLHRDLKPGNVMLRDDGSIALIDFGLARHEALAFETTDPGLIFGTPHYMSPEQGHGEPIDERSDLYSLGVICYEMLAGEKPYVAGNPMAIIYLHRKAPLPKLPPVLAPVQPLIERFLAKRPEDRFATAGEATRAIEDSLARLGDRENVAVGSAGAQRGSVRSS